MPAATSAQKRINACIAAISTVEVVAAAKQTMDWMGLACGLPRTPIPPLDEGEKHQMRTALDAIGFFDEQ